MRARNENAETLSKLATKTFVDTFSDGNRPDDIAQYLISTFSTEKQGNEIQDENRIVEIAWIKQVAVGFFYLRKGAPDPSVLGKKPIELQRLYVDSSWHGKGIGPALLNRAIEIAQSEGFSTLWLGVWEKNLRAQAFYRKNKFTMIGSHAFQLGSDSQNDLIMSLNLVYP